MTKKLIKFSQDNCRPCTMLADYLANTLEVEVEDRHIDELYELGLAVQGAPVLVMLEDGEISDYMVGFKRGKVTDMVKEVFNI